MTSILKNQILKHLTKFTKNLSPEKIKINAFKGEGDVSNLELDEDKLTELLELPNWLKIKRAACNKVSIKVQWTLIKRQPIVLILDEILLIVEALQRPRRPKSPRDSVPSYRSSTGSYGFTDRVIDGIKVKINIVKIVFTSTTFKANIELMRVVVSSKMPNWSEADHLRKTRVKSPMAGAILLFKEIEWDTTRIEANALQSIQATPVKLITNTIKIRTIIKKSLSNCAILDSKVEFILNDLFWVLTISQIKAAILFSESLMDLIRQSNELNKKHMQRMTANSISSNSGHQPYTVNQNSNTYSQRISYPINNMTNGPYGNPNNMASQMPITNSNRQRLYQKYDLKETSYHILIARVEFHFCEEGEEGKGMSKNAVVNGSIKLLFVDVQLDLYPHHLSDWGRNHFLNYKDLKNAREKWLTNSFSDSFHNSHTNTATQNSLRNQIMESVTVFRFRDFTMHCVATSSYQRNRAARQIPQPLLGSDITRHKFPARSYTLTLDITSQYWRVKPSNNSDSISDSQLPETTIFGQLNPFFVSLDWKTVVWLNAFYLNLKKELINLSMRLTEKESELDSVLQSQPKKASPTPVIHIETIMTRIVLKPTEEQLNKTRDTNKNGQQQQTVLNRPREMQIQIGSLHLDNLIRDDRDELKDAVRNYESSHWFSAKPNHTFGYQSSADSSFPFANNDHKIDFSRFYKEFDKGTHSYSTNRNFWRLRLTPLWCEFESDTTAPTIESPHRSRNIDYVSFLEPVNLTLLLLLPEKTSKPFTSPTSVQSVSQTVPTLIVFCGTLIPVISQRPVLELNIDHYQLLALYRVLDGLGDGMRQLKEDTTELVVNDNNKTSSSNLAVAVQFADAIISLTWRTSGLEGITVNQEKSNYQYDDEMISTGIPAAAPVANDDSILCHYRPSTSSDTPPLSLNASSTGPLFPGKRSCTPIVSAKPYLKEDLDGSNSHVSVASIAGSPGNYAAPSVTMDMSSNRRSYTSLSTIETDTSNTVSSNLLSCKSVRNLMSSAIGSNGATATGRMSRKSSQLSINSSSESGDKYMMTEDSDFSDDWISDNLLLNDPEIGEDVIANYAENRDIDEDGNILFGIGLGEDSSDLNTHQMRLQQQQEQQHIRLRFVDLRMFVGSDDAGSFVALSVFDGVFIEESSREGGYITLATSIDDDKESNKLSTNNTTDPTSLLPVLSGRIYISNNESDQVSLEFKISKQVQVPLQMSSLVQLADLFEDEIGITFKTNSQTNSSDIGSRIRLCFLQPVELNLIEDRPCSNQNTTCPGEHPNLRLCFPPGSYCDIEGVNPVIVSLHTLTCNHDNQYIHNSLIPNHINSYQPSNNSHNSREIREILLAERYSQSPPDNQTLQRRYSPILDELDWSVGLRNDKKLREMQRLYRHAQDEIERLRRQLKKVSEERDALYNLIKSPQTNC